MKYYTLKNSFLCTLAAILSIAGIQSASAHTEAEEKPIQIAVQLSENTHSADISFAVSEEYTVADSSINGVSFDIAEGYTVTENGTYQFAASVQKDGIDAETYSEDITVEGITAETVFADTEASDNAIAYLELTVSDSSLHTYEDADGLVYYHGYTGNNNEGWYQLNSDDAYVLVMSDAELEQQMNASANQPQTFADPQPAISYYAASTGSDTTGDGTLANPYATLNKAYAGAAVNTETNIYILDDITVSSTIAFNGNKTINLLSANADGTAADTGTESHKIIDATAGGATLLALTAGTLNTSYIVFDGNKGNGQQYNGGNGALGIIGINGEGAVYNANQGTVIQNFYNISSFTGGVVLIRNGYANFNGALLQDNITQINDTSGQTNAGVYYVGSADGGAFTNTVFKNLTSYQGGAAIRTNISLPITIDGCQFINNDGMTISGGSIYYTGGDLSIANSLFETNKSNANGGAVYAINGTVTIDNSTFTGSQAQAGSAIYQSGGTLTIKDSVTTDDSKPSFISNTGVTSGAIYFAGQSISVNNAVFNENKATNGVGAAITLNSGGTNRTLNIADSSFTKNSATHSGGAVYTGDVPTVVERSFFNENSTSTAAGYGGAIHNSSTLEITASQFKNNTASKSGGAISGNMVSISDSSILTGNKAQAEGGAVNCLGIATISDSKFNSNSAGTYGGAIYAGGLLLSNSTVNSNTSDANGGAITVGNYALTPTFTTSQITNSTISGNAADKNGGAIYTNGPIAIDSSTISSNTANNGAGIYTHTYLSYAGAVALQNGTKIEKNRSTGVGAGVFLFNGTSLTMKDDASIANNTVTVGEGGGIYQMASQTTVAMQDAASITGNRCGPNGNSGGVYNANSAAGSFSVKDSAVIDGNHVGYGDVAANYYILNTSANKNAYEITVAGALSDTASIHVMTYVNERDIKIAEAITGYSITEEDRVKFVHDRYTRGQTDAYPIVFDANSSTGNTNNLNLYASNYTEVHKYEGDSDLTEHFVGTPGSAADLSHREPKYGFTLSYIGYTDTAHSTEVRVNDGDEITVPADDSLEIVFYNTRNKYSVHFESEDVNTADILHGDPQQVFYQDKAAAGVGISIHDPVNYYFTGWKYTIATETGTVSEITMDYTDVPITGDVTFTATFAKVPFASIITLANGSVSVINGTQAKDIVDGITEDTYEWEADAEGPFTAIASFKADPNYRVKSIRVVIPSSGASAEKILDLDDTAAQTIISNAEMTAAIAIDADKSYGTVTLDHLEKSAQVFVEFEEKPQMTVTFDANGGTPAAIETRKVYEGDIIGEEPEVNPVWDGHYFVGYSENQNDTFDQYDPEYVITKNDAEVTKTKTYYAIWDTISTNEYDILVYLQTGTDTEGNAIYEVSTRDSFLRATANEGTTVYALSGNEPKSITGYTYHKNHEDELISGTVTSINNSDADKLILKVFYDLNKYDLMFEENGGTAVQDTSLFYKQALPDITITKEGSVFLGWYEDPGFVHAFDVTKDTMPSYNLTLYARWAKQYSIEYHLDGGTNSADNPASYVSGKGVDSFSDPVKEGSTFLGWYKDAAFTKPISAIDAATAGTIHLYAKWDTPIKPTAVPSPSATEKPAGKTCQDDGYPEGYTWSDEKQACIFTGETPVPTASAKPTASPSPSTETADKDPSITVTKVPEDAGGSSGSADGSQSQGADAQSSAGTENVPGQPADSTGRSWALINLLCAVLAAVLAVIKLLQKTDKTDDPEDEEDWQYDEDGNVIQVEFERKNLLFKIITAIAAVGSILLFILTENLSLPIGLVDQWTIWMVLILIAAIAGACLGSKWKQKED